MVTANGDVRPMNVVVDRDSDAASIYGAWATALAPGLPPTPAHDLIYRGGRTITQLLFSTLYVGGQAAWQQSDIQAIDAALGAAMSDRDLNNVMQQYFQGAITSTPLPSAILPGPAPTSVNQTDVEAMVNQLWTQGRLHSADLTSTVFNFMLPSGTILSDATGTSHRSAPHHRRHQQTGKVKDQVESLHGLGGYHGSIHVASGSGTDQVIYYAVGVYSQQLPDGTTNGIVAFDAPWKNVVATFYHELNEARTDADVEDANKTGNNGLLGWISQQGEECGDFPISEATSLSAVFQEVPLTDGSGTVPVQFMYSNAVHGPEGPIPNPH